MEQEKTFSIKIKRTRKPKKEVVQTKVSVVCGTTNNTDEKRRRWLMGFGK